MDANRSQAPPQGELARHRRRVLSLTCIGAFMGPLDSTIVSVALPQMGKSLNLSYSEALWVQAGYLLVLSIFLIPIGRLADARGRMRFYLAGTAVFGIFSVICALSPNGTFLIAARCFQAVGAACLVATSGALVTAVFPPQERGRALGFNVMAAYLGLTAGPVIGGLIVSHASWRWIFLINLPIAIATLANGWFLLGAENRDRKAARSGPAPVPGRLDWPGAVLLGLSLVCLLVPLTLVPFWGWDSARTIGLLVAAVVLMVAFIFVEDRTAEPLLDLDLVRKNHAFAAGTFAALLNYAGVFAVTILTSVYLQVVEGYTPQQAGLLLLVQPIFMAGLSPMFGRLSDRVGSRALASGGMVLCALGILQLAILPQGAHPFRVVLALGTLGVGMAMFSSPNTSAVMGSVERHQLSLASGFLGTMRSLGQGLSVGLLGAIAASGLGAVGARMIFLGEEASRAAATAFSDGYRTAMFVAAGLAVLGALVSLVRGAPVGQSPSPAGQSRSPAGQSSSMLSA
jgi:EmrB/QacA subfamily drug resistance transporter